MADSKTAETDQLRWNATEVETPHVMGSDSTHLRPRRPSSGNDIAQEERHSILRKGTRGVTRRHEKTMTKRSQRTSPVEINAESPDRAKQEVVIKTSRKVGQGLYQEGARDGTGERLRLGHKLWNI